VNLNRRPDNPRKDVFSRSSRSHEALIISDFGLRISDGASSRRLMINEKFNLDCFAKGQLMSAHLWQELSRA
jgi:hypothetical protein